MVKREIAIELKNIWKSYPLAESIPYITLRDNIYGFFAGIVQYLKTGKKKVNKNFWALKKINLKIYKGESVGIIGPNGAGKSTLLKLLSQITPPSKGEILINGKITSLLEVGTGFNPELTGRENIFLNGALLGMSLNEIKSKFNKIVKFAEISKFLDIPVKHYSSGMYMRLAFAIAVHVEQDILLLDEVLAVGDAKFQKKSISKMEEVTKSMGKTIIFVSHNMSAIQNICERCVFIEDGQVKASGKPSGVVEGYLKSSEPKSTIPLTERKDHRGSGRLRITKIHFKDSKGKSVTNFKSGQDVEIWFEYKLHDKNVGELLFGLGIDTLNEGNRIAFLSNKITLEKIDSSNGIFKIKIKRLPLTPGNYTMTILMHNEFIEVLDWVQRAASFSVEHSDFYGTNQLPPQLEGSMLLDYTFES